MKKSRLGKLLKEHRLAAHLTVQEAAARIGVPTSTYREWEYGRQIRGEPYYKISIALNISIAALLDLPSDAFQLELKSRVRLRLLDVMQNLESTLRLVDS